YADRLLYGTDMGFDKAMYGITFRILESLDEHFYEIEQFGYHWSLNGLALPDAVLQKIYHENASMLLAGRGPRAGWNLASACGSKFIGSEGVTFMPLLADPSVEGPVP